MNKSILLFIFCIGLISCDHRKMNLEESHQFVLTKLQSQLLDSTQFKFQLSVSKELTKSQSERLKELAELIYFRPKQLVDWIPTLEEFLKLKYDRELLVFLLEMKIKKGMITEKEAIDKINYSDSIWYVEMDQNDFRKKINLLEQRDTLNYKYYDLLGSELLESAKYESAIDAFTKCELLEPLYQTARTERALAKYKMGNNSEACKEWRTQGSESPGYYEKYCK